MQFMVRLSAFIHQTKISNNAWALCARIFFSQKKISLIHGTIKKLERKNKTSLIIFPVYHPAAGLRNLGNRQKLFKDFQKLKLILHDLI